MDEPEESKFREFMKRGSINLQEHNFYAAISNFSSAVKKATDSAQSAEATQMLGVCFRATGNLSAAQGRLEQARTYAAAAKDRELEGKILRDLAFVAHDRYMILKWLARRNFVRRASYNERLDELFDQAAYLYIDSKDLLRSTASLAELAMSQAGEGLLYYEHRWEERSLGRSLVHQAYAELVRLGHPVYKTNTLIRLLRTLPFLGRLRYARRIIEQTNSSSASSGARLKAVIVLIGGNIGWHMAAAMVRSS